MQTSNKLALLAGISTLAIAAPAMAQSHPVMSVTEQNTSGGTPAVPERAEQNEEIVVTGARPIAEAEATALKVQRNSDSLVTVAAADSVGRLPDQNIAQATSRLPGVAIERDQGQARYISLRGSPNYWTTLSFDGINVVSPEGRDARFDSVPSAIASQIIAVSYTHLRPHET